MHCYSSVKENLSGESVSHDSNSRTSSLKFIGRGAGGGAPGPGERGEESTSLKGLEGPWQPSSASREGAAIAQMVNAVDNSGKQKYYY